MRPEEQLRERIRTALQSRHGTNAVCLTIDNDGDAWSAGSVVGLGHDQTIAAHRESELDALTSLAIALGLDGEGNDPRTEAERLRAEELAADDRFEDACDARDNALDDRDGLIAEIKCLRANAPVAANRLVATCIANSLADAEAVRLSAQAENARLTREREAALDALYEYAPRCRNCGCVSTRVGGDYIALCDSDACARGVPDVRDVTHSDALRSANPLDDHTRPSPTAERDAALADAEALRLAARAYFATIDNAPPFGADDRALREHDAACDKAAHTLAVLAGARGPR